MAHRRQRSRRALDLTVLLAMVSTSSAVNLSQFQLIISNSIPKSCIRAYQTEIEGCKVKDFTGRRQCSAKCVKGVEQVQGSIQDACGDLNVSHKSLLGIVLSGDLVDTLCPGAGPTTVTTTIHPSPTKGGFSTIVTAPTSFSTETSRTTEKTTSTTPGASRSTSTSVHSTTVQSTTDQETPTPPATITESLADTTSAQNTPQPTVPSDSTQSTSSDDNIPTPFLGGTPFDPLPAQQGLAAVLSPGYGKEALVVAICATILMLW